MFMQDMVTFFHFTDKHICPLVFMKSYLLDKQAMHFKTNYLNIAIM